MTPAERLAASKPRQRPKRNGPAAGPRNLVWVTTLHARREALDLSMRDVAAAAGMSVTNYWAVEKGASLNLKAARRIADFFGATVEDLWPALLTPKPKE